MPLRPHLATLRQRADAIRAKASGIQRLSDEQLAWSPGGDRWPAALVLDHLNRVHELVLEKFEASLSEAPGAGPEREEPVKYGFMDRMMLKMMGPGAPMKVPVPPIFEPRSQANPSETVVPRFFELHDSIARIIDKADRFDLRRVRVNSPVSDRIKAGFIAYLEGTVAHEEYHWGQVEALLRDPAFPKA